MTVLMKRKSAQRDAEGRQREDTGKTAVHTPMTEASGGTGCRHLTSGFCMLCCVQPPRLRSFARQMNTQLWRDLGEALACI